MTNAEVPIPTPKHSRAYDERRYDLDRALKKLTSHLIVEGVIESTRARQRFMTKREMEKFKRGRRTGPKHYNRNGVSWKL